MTRPLRLEYPGSIWHLTARGNEKRNTFRDDRDRNHFLELLEEAVRRFDWILCAYVLMSNHFHLMVELSRQTLSRGMHWLNGEYAKWFNRRHQRVGHLFQSRFGSVLVQRETYFQEVLRYVVLNPVRARMVARPEHYAWSSYRETAGYTPVADWLAVDRVLESFGPRPAIARQEYRRFVEAGIGGTRRPWDQTVGQIYLGTDGWIERVREQIEIKPRSDEYPRMQVRPSTSSMVSIISAVAHVLEVPEDRVRHGRGGTPRKLAAWLGRYEGDLDLRSIAAALRLRSAGHASELISACDRTLTVDVQLRGIADRCAAALQEVEKTENRRPDPQRKRAATVGVAARGGRVP